MPIEYIHAAIGFTFIAVWAMIGQIAVRKP